MDLTKLKIFNLQTNLQNSELDMNLIKPAFVRRDID